MDFIINNWYIIVALIAVVGCFAIVIHRYFTMPTDEQISKLREWLLWAVTEAEAELGGGTGKLKLRCVYDLFVQRFPWLAKVISFERFSELVDDALVEMREMLEKNAAVAALVNGTSVEGR